MLKVLYYNYDKNTETPYTCIQFFDPVNPLFSGLVAPQLKNLYLY